MKPGHFFQLPRTIFTAGVLCSALAGSSAGQRSAAEADPVLLKPGSTAVFKLDPGAARNVAVSVGGGEAVTAAFQQTAGTISVTEACTTCASQKTRTNAAGIGSSISFSLIGADAATLSLTIRNPSKTRPAEVVATASPPHPAGDADRKQVEAEAAFAHAETLRAKRDAAGVDAAIAAYDRAIGLWHEAGDTADSTRALAWKAMLLGFVKNDLPAAQAVAKEALTSVAVLRGAEAANCWKIAGYVAAAGADYDAAEKDYATAIALFKETGDRLNQEILLDNKAKLARQQGRSDEALADADSAAEIAREIGDLPRQLSIAEELGSIHTERGELRPAYEAYQRALDLLKSTSYGPVEGYVWSDLGVLYTLVHEFDRAGEALGRAAAFWRKNPNLLGQINTLDDLGELYLAQGKLDKALGYLQQGLETANAHSLPRQQVYLLRAIGADRLRKKDLKGARSSLENARRIALQVGQGDELAAVYCSLGDLNAAQSRWAEAKAFYERCRSAAVAAKSKYDVIHSEGGLARAGLEAGQLDDALPHAEAALGEIESVRGHLSEQDLRTSFFTSMHDYYDLDIALCMRLDRRHPAAGYAWKAFLVSERARARQLLDQMFAAGVEQPLAAGSGSGEGQAAQGSASPLPLSLASIRESLLDRRTGLLEYWIGARSSFLWVITGNGLHSYRLPPSTALVNNAAALRRDLFLAVAPQADVAAEMRDSAMHEAEVRLTGDAERLGAALLPPRSMARGLRRLLVVQDEAVLSVPFAMLRYPAQGGETSTPLAARFVLVSEPSATALAGIIDRTRDSRPLRIAVFANPAAREAGGELISALKPAAQPASSTPAVQAAAYSRFDAGVEAALPPLRFADREAASIVSIYGSGRATLMTGAEASPESVKDLDWSRFTVAHFATHAIVDQRKAELSGLLLASPGRNQRHGPLLRYEEISRMHAPLDLVVLSACDTANGEQVPGEGLLGLARAFMAAGSERVLGTLWKVDDEATAAWMELFYRELKESGSPADALRMAQVRMAAAPRWRSPYYWAGFSLEGNWHAIQ